MKDKDDEFVYRGRSLKTIKERQTSQGGGFDTYLRRGVNRFKAENGENKVRILPPPKDIDTKRWGESWGLELWTHPFIGPDNSSFLCPKRMKGKRCPICEERGQLDPEKDEELVKKLRPQKRILCYVIDRDDEDMGPLVWTMPYTTEQGIQLISVDPDTNAGIMLDHHKQGFDLTFEKSGKGLTTKYSGYVLSRRAKPISEDAKEQKKWLRFITENPLPDLLVYHDTRTMEAAIMGKKVKDRDDDIEDDDDDKPAKKKAEKMKEDDLDDMDRKELKKLIKKHSLDIDYEDYPKDSKLKSAVLEALKEEGLIEDEDDDDKDDDDDDDDDEKPSKKKAKDEDDDDDDDKDDDDDDDDEPKSKTAKKSVEKLKKKKAKDEDEDDDDD